MWMLARPVATRGILPHGPCFIGGPHGDDARQEGGRGHLSIVVCTAVVARCCDDKNARVQCPPNRGDHHITLAFHALTAQRERDEVSIEARAAPVDGLRNDGVVTGVFSVAVASEGCCDPKGDPLGRTLLMAVCNEQPDHHRAVSGGAAIQRFN